MNKPQLEVTTAVQLRDYILQHFERVSEMYHSKPPFVMYDPKGIDPDERDSAYWRQGMLDIARLIERDFINQPPK